MDAVVNDCSLYGQFPAVAPFVGSLKSLLSLKERLERSGRAVRCHRNLLDKLVGPDQTFRQALASMSDRNFRNTVVAWLANRGPFWSDEPLHSGDDYFSVKGEIVTETGLAEAAMAALRGLPRAMLTFDPSEWTHDPVDVEYTASPSESRIIQLRNYWTLAGIEQHLQETRAPLASWEGLVQWTREECPRLMLTEDVIQALDGHPFIPGAARRFQELLSTLDTLKGHVTEDHTFTKEGMRLYQAHFVGDKAWFTDSSDAEKIEFQKELTFPDPGQPGAKRLFGWHGKVKIEQMRMHFSYPLRNDRPLHVVYIGPKITKR